MDFLTEIAKYLIDKAGPLAAILFIVIWLQYRLLTARDKSLGDVFDGLNTLREQMASNRETQSKFITLLEALLYGRGHDGK